MDSAPSSSSGRGKVILQPAYFTSSLYVNKARNDIQSLIQACYLVYSHSPVNPFATFKAIYRAQGWHWMQFKVLDDRTRETFLTVTHRLFVERTTVTEAEFTRVIALFGLYTFFFTQPPSGLHPHLSSVSHIPIPFDQYETLIQLPNILDSPFLIPTRTAVSYILNRMTSLKLFFLLPSSHLMALSPRELPREVLQEDPMLTEIGPRQRGRPSQRSKVLQAKAALDGVDTWITKSEGLLENVPKASLYQYQKHKEVLLQVVGQHGDALELANHEVRDRLKQAEAIADSGASSANMQRVDRAVAELQDEDLRRQGGLLGLLEGTGKVRTPPSA